MNTKKKAHFQKLSPKEITGKLNYLIKNLGVITVWQKASTVREDFVVQSAALTKTTVQVYPAAESLLLGKVVLCKFEVNGVWYFSTTKVVKDVGINKYTIKFTNDIFKSERRENFRLLTYPHHDVRVFFQLGKGYTGGNIVDIKTRISDTNLFKNFLTLIGQDSPDTGSVLALRVFDISASGISFMIGDLEKSYFKPGSNLKNIRLFFIDKEIVIPEGSSIHCSVYKKNEQKGIKQYKVGFEFKELTHELDKALSQKINDVLRKTGNKDFEDFIS
jgi:hypothetical protein